MHLLRILLIASVPLFGAGCVASGADAPQAAPVDARDTFGDGPAPQQASPERRTAVDDPPPPPRSEPSRQITSSKSKPLDLDDDQRAGTSSFDGPVGSSPSPSAGVWSDDLLNASPEPVVRLATGPLPDGGTAPAGGSGGTVVTSDAAVLAAIKRSFPTAEWGRAAAVAECESNNRSVVSKPNRNGSRDWGVFQLNDGGTLQELLRSAGQPATNLDLALDVEWNVAAAARLHGGGGAAGWSRWTCAAKLEIVDGLWSRTPGPKADAYRVD